MNKIVIYSVIIALSSLCTTFTSCTRDEDTEAAYVLEGEWTGDWQMYYQTRRGNTFYASYTDIVFYLSGNYTNHGYGYQVDFYNYGPYTEIYSQFTWSIEHGTIYIDYPDDHRYDTTIYEYRLSDSYFSGYLGDSDQFFRLRKLVNFNWAHYYEYGDYYYWSNSSYTWDDDDYYWSKQRKSNTPPSDSIDNEPDRIVKIGSRLAE
ncbi:MAG: hypothetical protein K2H92_09485 [Bacteroidaceae bacterium]|nr:hypothetical protein [Bacteroidaceae bacterium]